MVQIGYMQKLMKSYDGVKLAFRQGKVHRLTDMTKYVSIVHLAEDMGQNYNTIRYKLADPGKLVAQEMVLLAELIGIKASEVFDQVVREIRR